MRALAVLVAACGAPPSPPPKPPAPEPPSKWSAPSAEKCRKHDLTPFGSPADYTTPILSGFAIWEPRICDNQSAYIRVERLDGKRRLGTRETRPGHGFDEGCMQAPANPSDPAQCPVINFDVIGGEVWTELRKRGANAGGPGLGPCGDFRTHDYRAWNMSVSVMSWAEADEAVQLVAQALERYDVVGYLGVAITGPICDVKLL